MNDPDELLQAIRSERSRYDNLLDDIAREYVRWLGPLSEKTDTDKMHWWFAKAKQLALRITELEEQLEKKRE